MVSGVVYTAWVCMMGVHDVSCASGSGWCRRHGHVWCLSVHALSVKPLFIRGKVSIDLVCMHGHALRSIQLSKTMLSEAWRYFYR